MCLTTADALSVICLGLAHGQSWRRSLWRLCSSWGKERTHTDQRPDRRRTGAVRADTPLPLLRIR